MKNKIVKQVTMKKTLFYILSLFIIFVAMTASAEAKTFNIVQDRSSLDFYVKHDIGFTSGWFKSFMGTIEVEEAKDFYSLKGVVLDVDATSVFTFNERRDAMMQSEEFLNSAQYPALTLKTKKVNAKKNELVADVMIRGITKQVTFKYNFYGKSVTKDGKPKTFVALQGLIDRKDFGVPYNVDEGNESAMLGTKIELLFKLEAVH